MILYVFLLLYIGLFEKDRCKALIYAGNIVTLYMYLVTQALSLFCIYTRLALIICYIPATTAVAFLYFKTRKSNKDKVVLSSNHINKSFIIITASFILFAIPIIILSVKTPLYNWDSMTYHMPRVFSWYVNRSVAHFAAGNIRMLASPPLAEFFVLNSFTVFGTCDIFSNLIQTVFYLLSGVVIFGTVKRFVKGNILPLAGAILYLSQPICFGEAITTQVDIVSGFYLLSFVYLAIDYIDYYRPLKFDKKSALSAVIMSLSVAFSYLCKPSVCIAIAVFCIAIAVMIIYRKDSLRLVFTFAGVSLPVAFITVLPEMIRNFVTFHALTSPVTGSRQLIGTLKPNYVFIEFLKNAVWNMPLPGTERYNDIIFRGTKKIARILSVNIDDPAISEDGIYYNLLEGGTWNHDQALNPIIEYVFLITLAVFIILIIWYFVREKRKYKLLGIKSVFLTASVASVVLFLSFVRWEPFVNRYFVGYISLLCICVMLMLEFIFTKQSVKNIFTGIVILLCMVQIGILYKDHILLATAVTSREEGYYIVNLPDKYMPSCDYIIEEKYDNVGICCGGDSYVYPTMYRLYNEGIDCRFVLIDNESAMYEKTDDGCRAILVLDRDCPDELTYAGKIYTKEYVTPGYGNCCVYILK